MYSDNVCDDSLGVLRDLVQHFYESIIDASIIDVVKACSLQSERDALSLHRNIFVKRKYLKRSNATRMIKHTYRGDAVEDF